MAAKDAKKPWEVVKNPPEEEANLPENKEVVATASAEVTTPESSVEVTTPEIKEEPIIEGETGFVIEGEIIANSAEKVGELAVTIAEQETPAIAKKYAVETAKSTKVTVVVPKDYKLTLDNYHVLNIQHGVQEMEREHAEHWWSIKQGVEIYTSTEIVEKDPRLTVLLKRFEEQWETFNEEQKQSSFENLAPEGEIDEVSGD